VLAAATGRRYFLTDPPPRVSLPARRRIEPMKLRTLVIDALYLNWALPADALPPPPPPLRYQCSEWQGRRWAFASALLFRHRSARIPYLPFPRLSYPQANLRLYAVDGDGVPCVLFREMLMPRWVQPAVLLTAGHPVSTARFSFPRPSRDPDADAWHWLVEQGGRLEVVARRGAPQATGAGPSLGGWEETVRFFRERPRGYIEAGDRLRRIETEHPRATVWPMTVELTDVSLLPLLLPLDGHPGWPPLHSAWLCPEIPFVFAFRLVPKVALETGMPHAAATRSCARSVARRPPPRRAVS
jgi:hypothetical protein